MRFNSDLKGGGPPTFKFPFGPSVEEVVPHNPIDLHHQRPSDRAYRSRHAPPAPVSSPRRLNQSCSMPATTHMATRPGLPARHSSLFPQIGWLPSSRRNALVALEQDPVPPTSHSEPASPSGASSASPFSQWSSPPLNRWA